VVTFWETVYDKHGYCKHGYKVDNPEQAGGKEILVSANLFKFTN